MAWFKRQNNSGGNQTDYLNAPDTAGRPMAVPAILVTFLLISAIALLLFSAGRWAYNEYIAEDPSVTTSVEQPADDNASPQTPPSGQTTQQPSQDVTSPASDGADTTNNQAAENNTQQSDTSGTTSNTPTTTQSSTNPSTVPNTGPESVLGIFAVSVILGAIAHNRWTVSRQK